MKKMIWILVAAAIVIAGAVVAVVLLTGEDEPSHTHTYSTEWEKDLTAHWHVCTGEGCTEIKDKANHVWDGGNITTEPTAEAAGVTTYECTECKATKTAEIPFTGVSEEKWNLMIADHNFENYTLTQDTYTVQDDGTESQQNATIKITPDKIKLSGTVTMIKQLGEIIANPQPTNMSTVVTDAETVAMFKDGYEQIFRALLKEYESFVWDDEKKVYIAPNGISVNIETSEGTYSSIVMASGEVKLDADGRLVEFKADFTQVVPDPSGTTLTVNAKTTWGFSDYGTTVIE